MVNNILIPIQVFNYSCVLGIADPGKAENVIESGWVFLPGELEENHLRERRGLYPGHMVCHAPYIMAV